MQNACIIHGTYGHPNENWFPWLKEELVKLGYNVEVPCFSTPENQSLKSWTETFVDTLKKLDSDSILIGHSLGVAFILSVLETLNHPVKAVFLVSGFIGTIGNKEFDVLNGSFCDREFDWNKIKSNTSDIHIYHSDNDPYVPIEKAQEISKELGVDVTTIPGAGHFNKASGYDKFDELLIDIKKLIY